MKKAFKETKLDFNINGVFAVRYIHQDDIWLSPFYKVRTSFFFFRKKKSNQINRLIHVLLIFMLLDKEQNLN